ncbi:uncharacterized protein SCHCODRAFT_02503570 [Schizophyllum commune H4-8]|nr:uncharacterized protein SCHCODRAFT_02503570 [Schizophyllum commune H4-8]KAI5892533.1 hypothetical protein SCHCODRAFT_02503570 [Schizophyllum commune H4-8]
MQEEIRPAAEIPVVFEAESSTAASDRSSALALREQAPERKQAHALHLILPFDSEPIPGALVEDALDTISQMMPDHSFLFPVRKYRAVMQNCDWDVRLLAPQERVLTTCLLAFASLVSVNPFYVGHDANGHKFPDTHLRWEKVNSGYMEAIDIREIGRRRRPICTRFYGEAVRQAHQDGITSFASKENAVSCILLNMLDVIYDPQTSMPWANAAIWQLRTICEQVATDIFRGATPRGTSEVVERIQYRASMSAIAACCVSKGKSMPFSPHDEAVIAGPEPKNIDDLLAKIADYSRHHAVVDSLNSIGARYIRLTRDALENIVGVVALHEPLDELEVSRHVSAVEQSFTTVSRFRRFIQSLGDERELRLCLYSTSATYTSLAVALYHTLRRRLSESAVSATGQAARLIALCRRSRAIAARYVVEAVNDLRGLIAAHWLGWFTAFRFEAWAEILLNDKNGEALDENEVSEEERLGTLMSLREMLQFSLFIGIERPQIVAAITSELDPLRAGFSGLSSEPQQSPQTGNNTTASPSSSLLSDALSFASTPTFPTDVPMLSGDQSAPSAHPAVTPAIRLSPLLAHLPLFFITHPRPVLISSSEKSRRSYTNMMSLHGDTHPIFPPELICMVVENLVAEKDIPSLRQCALSLRCALPTVRRCLFALIILHVKVSPKPSTLITDGRAQATPAQRLLEVVTTAPPLAGYVRGLYLDINIATGVRARDDPGDAVPPLLALFRHLECMEICAVSSHEDEPEIPLRIVAAIDHPSLTTLRLSSVIFPVSAFDKLSALQNVILFDAVLVYEVNDHPTQSLVCPKVEQLGVSTRFGGGIQDFYSPLFFISPPPYFCHLVYLDVRNVLEGYPNIISILHACSGTLQYLDLPCPVGVASIAGQQLSMLKSLRRLAVYQTFMSTSIHGWLRESLETICVPHLSLVLVLEEPGEDIQATIDMYAFLQSQAQDWRLLDRITSGDVVRYDSVKIRVLSAMGPDPEVPDTLYCFYNCDRATALLLELLENTAEKSALSVSIDGHPGAEVPRSARVEVA